MMNRILLVLFALGSLTALPVASDNITISPPDIDPPGGTFVGDVTVTLIAIQPHASIFWTRDGETPTNASRLYTEPIYLFEPGTWKIQAIAVTKVGSLADSVVVSRTFVVTPSKISIPRVFPAKGKYRGFVSVSLGTSEVGQLPTEADQTKKEVKIQYVVDVENPGDTWQTFSEPFPLDIPGEHIVKARVAVTTTFIPVGKTAPESKVLYSPIARFRYEVTPPLLYDVSTECKKCSGTPTVGKYFSIYLQNPEPRSKLFLTTSSKGCEMDKHILDDTDKVDVLLRQVVYRFVTYTEMQPKVFVCLKEPSNVNQTFVTVPRRPRSGQGATEAFFSIEPAFGAIKKQDTAAPVPITSNAHPSSMQEGRSSGGSIVWVFGGLCVAMIGVCALLINLMRKVPSVSGHSRRTALRTNDDDA